MNLPPEAPRIPQPLLDHATLLADRYCILPLLPRHAVFAEIGVGLGHFSDTVLSVCDPARFIAIDTFDLHTLPTLWGRPSAEALGGLTHIEAYRTRFQAEIIAGRMQVMQGDSAACLEQISDGSVDVMYIDADHRYEFVKRDLAAARPKVRDGGWIIVNDYLMVAALGDAIPYGVVNATNEFMIEHEWGMQYFALQTQMFCDVVLRQSMFLKQATLPDKIKADDAMANDNAALRETISAMRRSGSWRAMAPLRAASQLAGRPLRRLFP